MFSRLPMSKPPDFSRRSEESEWMDDMSVGGADLERTLDELREVNAGLGGYRTTLDALDRVLTPRREPWRLLDVGTGSADIPEEVVRHARRRGIPVRLTAIDLNPTAVAYARRKLSAFPEIEVVQADVFN